MSSEKRDFDKEAAAWDERPERVRLAHDVAEAIMRQVPVTHEMDVLDFGCGTGLLTLLLQPHARFVTGIDSSAGMLDILKAKIAGLKPANIRALRCDLEKGETLPGRYDLIVSSMTLHHINEIEPLLAQLYSLLAPGGFLCVADLDSEQGRFHGDNTGVFHFGFDRTALRGAFAAAGLVDVSDSTAATIVKPGKNGEMGSFGVFLVSGRKADGSSSP